jgi:riboflavin kinase/FMN adenylyltransferase
MTTVLTRRFRVFRGPSAVVSAIGPNVLALAGFDGVHIGHRDLLRRAAEEATERGLPVGAATFDDQKLPRRNGHKNIPALSSLSDRLRLIQQAGMDFVVLFPGNPGALGVPTEMFTHRILLGVMTTQLVVVRERAEPPGSKPGVAGPDVEAIAVARIYPNSWVSTTRIRERLGVGDLDTVNHLLGRRYTLTATVREVAGGQMHASVPSSRMMPAAGHYRVAVDFKSGSVPELVESVATVSPVGPGAAGHHCIALDRPVDHGRLRVGFLTRCASAEVTEPTHPWSDRIPTVSTRHEVR